MFETTNHRVSTIPNCWRRISQRSIMSIAISRSKGLIQAQRVHQGVDLENQRVASSLQMVGVFEGKERGENMGGDSSTNACFFVWRYNPIFFLAPTYIV